MSRLLKIWTSSLLYLVIALFASQFVDICAGLEKASSNFDNFVGNIFELDSKIKTFSNLRNMNLNSYSKSKRNLLSEGMYFVLLETKLHAIVKYFGRGSALA